MLCTQRIESIKCRAQNCRQASEAAAQEWTVTVIPGKAPPPRSRRSQHHPSAAAAAAAAGGAYRARRHGGHSARRSRRSANCLLSGHSVICTCQPSSVRVTTECGEAGGQAAAGMPSTGSDVCRRRSEAAGAGRAAPSRLQGGGGASCGPPGVHPASSRSCAHPAVYSQCRRQHGVRLDAASTEIQRRRHPSSLACILVCNSAAPHLFLKSQPLQSSVALLTAPAAATWGHKRVATTTLGLAQFAYAPPAHPAPRFMS